MARTNKTLNGMEALRKGMRLLAKGKKKYDEAWERSQKTPRKQRIKRLMDGGYNP